MLSFPLEPGDASIFSHAAMAGKYQREQTLLLPAQAMIDQRRSPLRILERVKERQLT
jgi:hypothetical protein